MFFAFCFSSSWSLFSWCKRYYLPFFLPFLERSLDPWCLESFLIVVAGGGCKDVLASVGYLARNVSNAELEKPCSRWCLSSLLWIISHFLYSGLSPRHLDCLLFSWDSKYGLWTSSICISQEFVGNVEIWVCPSQLVLPFQLNMCISSQLCVQWPHVGSLKPSWWEYLYQGTRQAPQINAPRFGPPP